MHPVMKAIFLLLLFALTACAAPFGSKEEKVPASVVTATRRQIKTHFGTNDLKGIPLLDQSVDWNWFTNWPDEFALNSKTYRLRLQDTSGGDYWTPIRSRRDVKPGMAVFAIYYDGTNFPPEISVSAAWASTGDLYERALNKGSKSVFVHQFVRSQLYCFMRDDVQLARYAMDYFDAEGKLAGTIRDYTPQRDECIWRRLKMDRETFDKQWRAELSKFK